MRLWPGNGPVAWEWGCDTCMQMHFMWRIFLSAAGKMSFGLWERGSDAHTHTCTHTCTHTHTHAHTQIQSKIKQASTTFHLQRNTNNSILSNLFQRLCHAAMCEEIIVGTQYSNNLIRSKLQTASCRQLHDQYIVLPCTHTHSNNVSLTVLWHAYTVWIHSAYCYERPTWAHTLICVCTYTM